ncbi:MAG: hypothetical protein U5O39_16135 [Gammaproteobacteria bacterium]|nr:hypothetical protein [Gammaproteobacteria bacterium]
MSEFDTWKPITDDDETIRAALDEASMPALICCLVHLTGDVSPVHEIELETGFLADPNGGLSEDEQRELAGRVFEALKALRDGEARAARRPGRGYGSRNDELGYRARTRREVHRVPRE